MSAPIVDMQANRNLAVIVNRLPGEAVKAQIDELQKATTTAKPWAALSARYAVSCITAK